MTLYIILAAIFIFVSTQLMVPIVIRFSIRHGILALPSERRIHKHSTAQAGGLSFALPIILMQLLLSLFTRGDDISRLFFELSAVSTVALTLGLLDDRFESPARYKLLWQILLGVVMYIIGYRVQIITNPLGEHFILGWISFPVTVIWYVVVINAINLIDGMDGLATGISAITCLVLLTMGIMERDILVISLSLFLFAGLLAFLRFNFHPAKIFLGETGTQFIALNIAAISTTGASQFKGITSLTLIIPLAALAIPMLDVALAIFRRIGSGSFSKADKAHIHHTMLDFGLSQRAVSIIVYFVTFLFGLIAIGFSLTNKKILFSLLMLMLALVVIVSYILMRMEKKK